ncbi:hypothetical protein Q7C36_000679 [Tachysurus vachellii]|uniref:Uncharacterized protein n=1 Tax=Tachysurus vachellii TaxID=175792 RepID=A0AA88NWG7_TACVA|nr:hypothetical protein Q7C36_000679 [Tachysurus vachellii]
MKYRGSACKIRFYCSTRHFDAMNSHIFLNIYNKLKFIISEYCCIHQFFFFQFYPKKQLCYTPTQTIGHVSILNTQSSLQISSKSFIRSFSPRGVCTVCVQLPTKPIREQYAHGIVVLFPSLRDPYSKKGYDTSVHRKIRRGSLPLDSPRDVSPGGPKCQRATNFEGQLDGDACRDAMSLLNHTTDKSLIFQKMRETFQHRQKLVKDPGSSADILSTFPRLLDTKGLVDQDFTLLFDAETSSRLLQRWDTFFGPNVIKEAKQVTSTPELSQLLLSAERPEGSYLHETIYDQEMASLLLLIHLLPPPPGGQKSPNISACDAAERLVIFHKSCCSLEEHLNSNQHQHPYLLAVGCQKSKIDSFYIALDKHLIPCHANRSLGAFDELFKAHFVFNFEKSTTLM